MTDRAEGFWWVRVTKGAQGHRWAGEWEVARVGRTRSTAMTCDVGPQVFLHDLPYGYPPDDKSIEWGPYLGKEPSIETMLQACNELLMQKRASMPVPKFGAKVTDALRDAVAAYDARLQRTEPRFTFGEEPEDACRCFHDRRFHDRACSVHGCQCEGFAFDVKPDAVYKKPRTLPDGTVDLSTWEPFDP